MGESSTGSADSQGGFEAVLYAFPFKLPFINRAWFPASIKLPSSSQGADFCFAIPAR